MWKQPVLDPSYVDLFREEKINRLENFFLPNRLTSASADAWAVRFAMNCGAFCSRLAADEATAEAAKTSILTRLGTPVQGVSLICKVTHTSAFAPSLAYRLSNS
jgi:hypothetical protein